MPPTIFNMVVDMVIFHWEIVVAREDVGSEGFRREVQKLATLLYVDDFLLASPRLDRLQEALHVLTGIFNRLVLKKMWKIWLAWCSNHVASHHRPLCKVDKTETKDTSGA